MSIDIKQLQVASVVVCSKWNDNVVDDDDDNDYGKLQIEWRIKEKKKRKAKSRITTTATTIRSNYIEIIWLYLRRTNSCVVLLPPLLLQRMYALFPINSSVSCASYSACKHALARTTMKQASVMTSWVYAVFDVSVTSIFGAFKNTKRLF